MLCHRHVDPTASLNEAMRCLVPGGIIVLNLPAYQWLYSAHDVEVHTARRFTLQGARRMLEDAGFTEVYATYWNTFLFPLMVLQRQLGLKSTSDLPGFLNALFKLVTRRSMYCCASGCAIRSEAPS